MSGEAPAEAPAEAASTRVRLVWREGRLVGHPEGPTADLEAMRGLRRFQPRLADDLDWIIAASRALRKVP